MVAQQAESDSTVLWSANAHPDPARLAVRCGPECGVESVPDGLGGGVVSGMCSGLGSVGLGGLLGGIRQSQKRAACGVGCKG
jgi:hypothetical protein